MSIMLGKHRGLMPSVCIVCGREAGSMGYVPEKSTLVGWRCERLPCRKNLRRVYNMKEHDLNRNEMEAIGTGAREIKSAVFEATINALWDAGVRDLSDLSNPAAFSAAEQNLNLTPHLETFLLSYSKAISALLDPPF
jgi:hypothetical protein